MIYNVIEGCVFVSARIVKRISLGSCEMKCDLITAAASCNKVCCVVGPCGMGEWLRPSS